jgi:hypothetical protein
MAIRGVIRQFIGWLLLEVDKNWAHYLETDERRYLVKVRDYERERR